MEYVYYEIEAMAALAGLKEKNRWGLPQQAAAHAQSFVGHYL